MYGENIKYHPRMLELRVCIIYDNLYDIFGGANAFEIIKGFCEALKIDFSCVDEVLRNHSRIKRLSKSNRKEYNTQVFVLGECWEENKNYTSRVYLKGLKGAYRNYNDITVDDTFLAKLDNYVICLDSDYKINNVKNFLINFNWLVRLFV